MPVLKDRYYHQAVKLLARVLRPPPNAYICPVCVKAYDDLRELSLEHVPPESAGGKVICLTCRSCNSRAGNSVDYAMAKEKYFRKFGSNDGDEYRVKLQVKGEIVNASFSRNKSGINIVFLPKYNNPHVLDKVQKSFMTNDWKNTKFKITVSERYTRHIADVSYLKSAYLVAFAKFGYRWILREEMEVIRQQIRHPAEKLLEGARVYLYASPPIQPGLYVVREPMPYLFVVIDGSGVVLPWVNGDSSEVYDWLSEQRKSREKLTCNFVGKWSWPEHPEFYFDQIEPRRA